MTAGTTLARPGRARKIDVAIAAGACPLDLITNSDVLSRIVDADVLGAATTITYAAAGFALLAWRRRWPVIVTAVLLAHLLGAILLLPDYRPLLAVPLALFTVAAQCPTRLSIITFGASYVLATIAYVVAELSLPLAPLDTPEGVMRGVALGQLLILGTVWAFGRWTRASRLNAQYLQELASLRQRDAVRTERSAIARELHDVVSRAVTIMVLHASGARENVHADPSRAVAALNCVESVGTEAMTELRRMLSVLRHVGDDQDAIGASEQIADIDALVSPFRLAGLIISTEQRGRPRSLTPEVALAAVRILQEGLTNALRHAGPGAAVAVTTAWNEESLAVAIVDDGGSGAAVSERLSAGVGLAGVRERVMLTGGTVDAGARPDGGFVLHAHLPAHPATGAPTSTELSGGSPRA
ncbi:sensor histidine kinase [Actinomycetospora flava]|uniref:histidine kinase n=1 Tax=Actinomycetospora flava TaxID=3129232 RepID=A0ABU8M7E3_9PSEU